MKKFGFILLSLLLALTNCKKDEDEPQDQEQPKAVPVSITTTDNTRFSSEIRKLLEVGDVLDPVKSLTSTDTDSFTYDGRCITKKTTTSDGNIFVRTYYYNDLDAGLLDSIVKEKNGEFDGVTEYDISNGEILAIRKYNKYRVMTSQSLFSNFSNGHPTSISYKQKYGTGYFNISGTLNYSGSDMTGYTLTGSYLGNNVTLAKTYSYDDKKNVFLNVVTIESPLASTHNITDYTYAFSYASVDIQFNKHFEYNYNGDNYPVSSTVTVESETSGGTEVSTYETEIEYEEK